MKLLGVVARLRLGDPDAGQPLAQLEYVKRQDQGLLALSAEPELVWTLERAEAEVMPWDAAEALAEQLGRPAHAVTVSAEEPDCAQHREAQARPGREVSRSLRVSPQDVYERNEREHLA